MVWRGKSAKMAKPAEYLPSFCQTKQAAKVGACGPPKTRGQMEATFRLLAQIYGPKEPGQRPKAFSG